MSVVPSACRASAFKATSCSQHRHITGTHGRHANSVRCLAAAKDLQTPAAQQLSVGLMAAASVAAALTLTPLDAHALSGGGSISQAISGEDYSNKDLRKLNLRKVVMRKTNFANSNLTGVSLFGSLAEGANFRGAILTQADLESGNFEDADFTGAVLEAAYVNNAQFKNAIIKDTDWTDVVLRKDVQLYLCERASGVNPVTGVDTRESLFCK